MNLALQTTVGELVSERPGRCRIFERLEIDYCCGGRLSLAQACENQQLDPQLVLQQLREADALPDSGEMSLVDADAMSLTALVDHIEQTHHEYMKGELPRLDALTQKVLELYGTAAPRLADVRRAFVTLYEELVGHMENEEKVLFPIVRQMESAGDLSGCQGGSVANPIRQMEHEHDEAGKALAIMHGFTDGYQPPEWACSTYQAMLDGLKQLEWDLHQHIHKENNILFPKVVRLEAELTATHSSVS